MMVMTALQWTTLRGTDCQDVLCMCACACVCICVLYLHIQYINRRFVLYKKMISQEKCIDIIERICINE